MAFNPMEHLTKLKNKDYLEVKWRLVWLRDVCQHAQITTSLIHLDMDKGVAVFKATVEDGNGGVGEGHGSESVKDFGDYIEKAETKAIGRALAALGYGTQFAPEIEEGARIVDSPVQQAATKPAPTAPTPQASKNKPVEQAKDAPIPTVSQLRSLAAKHVGVGAFDAIVGVLKATYPHTDLKVDDAWEEKHCKHAYDLLKKQINEKKQALAKAS